MKKKQHHSPPSFRILLYITCAWRLKSKAFNRKRWLEKKTMRTLNSEHRVQNIWNVNRKIYMDKNTVDMNITTPIHIDTKWTTTTTTDDFEICIRWWKKFEQKRTERWYSVIWKIRRGKKTISIYQYCYELYQML